MENQPASVSDPSSESNSVSLVLFVCILSILLIYLVYSQNIIFGSKAGNWVYPYFDPIPPVSRWLYLIVIGLLGFVLFVGEKFIKRFEKWTLLGCFILICLIEVFIHNVYPTPLWILVDSNVSNSFYTVAGQYTPAEILQKYNDPVQYLPGHAGTNMPGKILLFTLFNLVTSSRQTIGYLIVTLSTLGAPLIYGICKLLFNDQRSAFYAFLLYALVPSKLFYFPILNTVTPLFVLLCLYLFLLFLNRKQPWLLVLLGAALFLLVFFEPSPLVTGIVFVGILLHSIVEKKTSKKEILYILILPVITFLVLYLVMKLFFSFDLFHALTNMMKVATKFNGITQRDYWIWVKENAKEFLYAGGIPVMLLFIYSTLHILSDWRSFKVNLTGWKIEKVYLLSVLLTFLVVLFWGVNRGEITRLWIYLAVFFQIPAALFLAKAQKNNILFFAVSAILVVQAIVTLQRVAFIMH